MSGGVGPCECGHTVEEHGHDKKHPGSTACTEKGCDCIAYEEADDEEFRHEGVDES